MLIKKVTLILSYLLEIFAWLGVGVIAGVYAVANNLEGARFLLENYVSMTALYILILAVASLLKLFEWLLLREVE